MASQSDIEAERAVIRAAIERFGARGAVWVMEGRDDEEMESLTSLTGTKIGKAFEACQVRFLDAVQCAEIFGVTENRWSARTPPGMEGDGVMGSDFTPPDAHAASRTKSWHRRRG